MNTPQTWVEWQVDFLGALMWGMGYAVGEHRSLGWIAGLSDGFGMFLTVAVVLWLVRVLRRFVSRRFAGGLR